MNITCPSCGTNGSLELFLADTEFRKAVLTAAELPSNTGALVLRYIGLFRPGKRQLTAARATKLLGEVFDLIQADEVKLGQQSEKVLSHTWQRALEAVLNSEKLTLPLKNHNYLIKIALNMVNHYEALPDVDGSPVVVRRSSTNGMKSVGSIADGSAEKSVQAEQTLQRMTVEEKAALRSQATEKLIASGIARENIIKPMLDGMVLSIIMGNA